MQIFWARLIKSMFFFWSLRNHLILARARQELLIIKIKLQLQMTCKLLAIAFAVIGTEGLKLQNQTDKPIMGGSSDTWSPDLAQVDAQVATDNEEANELSQAERGWGKMFKKAAKNVGGAVADEAAATAASSFWDWFAQVQADAEAE